MFIYFQSIFFYSLLSLNASFYLSFIVLVHPFMVYFYHSLPYTELNLLIKKKKKKKKIKFPCKGCEKKKKKKILIKKKKPKKKKKKK